jgi:hypothetical protein
LIYVKADWKEIAYKYMGQSDKVLLLVSIGRAFHFGKMWIVFATAFQEQVPNELLVAFTKKRER